MIIYNALYKYENNMHENIRLFKILCCSNAKVTKLRIALTCVNEINFF